MSSISASPVLQSAVPLGSPLLVSLPSLSPEAFEEVVGSLGQAFAGTELAVATPDAEWQDGSYGRVRLVPYTPVASSSATWTVTAADFLNAHELSRTYHPRAILILSAEAQSLVPARLRAMVDAALEGGADLVVPRYALPPRSGLVNSAILYPLTRALFGSPARFPLPLDLCVSGRMAERMATSAQRLTAANEPEAVLWPVAEAAVAGYTILQVDVGSRTLPVPPSFDLDVLLGRVAGSLFAEIDARAAFWQRSRVALAERRVEAVAYAPHDSPGEVQEMIERFRLAYGNLSEVWSLVLPPHSLLGLKRMSVMNSGQFVMPSSLWARIVYDFLLAYRLRTINRGHLLGALTPLYLAWAASHILRTDAGAEPESEIEGLASAFEAEKPYLVSRWRWPDRFNP